MGGRAGARGADHRLKRGLKMGFQALLMGVETPIPPIMINTAAPDGAPPRRIKTVEIIIY